MLFLSHAIALGERNCPLFFPYDPKLVKKVKFESNFCTQILESITQKLKSEGGRGVGMIHITKGNFEAELIPVPPLEVQQRIVDTIETERVLVESARTLIDLYTQKTTATIAKLWSE